MIKALVFTMFISICSPVVAMECFSEHLKKAIENNRHRRELYSKLTNSKSRRISNKLIFAEKIASLYAKQVMKKVRSYNKAGIPILCLDFVTMELTPKFQGQILAPSSIYQNIEVDKLKSKLRKLLKNEKFDEIVEFIEEEINRAQYQGYNCMVKHVLESLARSSYLTPHYIQHAKSLNLKSPKDILKNYLKQNIISLSFMHSLDKDASTLQENGIPILCGDVPEIPLRLDYEMELSKY